MMSFSKLSDQFRILRSFIVGLVVTMVFIHFLSINESLTFSITAALLVDFISLMRKTWLMNNSQTRVVFSRFDANEISVAERTIALVFLSVGLLSFCIADIHIKNNILPNNVIIFVSFAALFLTWFQLHNGFALYYAKRYFEVNPHELSDLSSQKGFIFAGGEPTFSDFLYVSYSIGLTYSMTDCGIEDSSVRRIVIIHCLTSFLFTSTALSIIISLATQVS
jgi:uncharacterized membrane protein